METNTHIPTTSYKYSINMAVTGEKVTFAYYSDILASGSSAQRTGNAVVSYYGIAFSQDCETISNDSLSAKKWRELWADSEPESPAPMIQLWLQKVANGLGAYEKRPVDPADFLPLPDGGSQKAFSVRLSNIDLNWNALCDAHLDSTFGGQSLLTDIAKGTATLYFDSETQTLLGVRLSARHEQTELSGTIVITPTQESFSHAFPAQDKLIQGTLSEEWSILNDEQTAGG